MLSIYYLSNGYGYLKQMWVYIATPFISFISINFIILLCWRTYFGYGSYNVHVAVPSLFLSHTLHAWQKNRKSNGKMKMSDGDWIILFTSQQISHVLTAVCRMKLRWLQCTASMYSHWPCCTLLCAIFSFSQLLTSSPLLFRYDFMFSRACWRPWLHSSLVFGSLSFSSACVDGDKLDRSPRYFFVVVSFQYIP